MVAGSGGDVGDLARWAEAVLSKGEHPPPGFTRAPGSKVGLWRRRGPKGWEYWRPPSGHHRDAPALARKLSPTAAKLLVVAVGSEIESGYVGATSSAPSAAFYEARGAGNYHEAKASLPVRNKLAALGLIESSDVHTRGERGWKHFGQTVHHMSAGTYTFTITDLGRAVAAELAKIHPELRPVYEAALDKVLREERGREIDDAPGTLAWRALNILRTREGYDSSREIIRAGVEAVGTPEAQAAFAEFDADPRPDNPARAALKAALTPEPFQ